MMRARLILASACFFVLLPVAGHAEVYQWTDDRGVIHLTDNLQAVPESVRGSPALVIRKDFDNSGRDDLLSLPDQRIVFEPFAQPESREASAPAELDKTAPPTNIFYGPQQIIVVTNTAAIRPRKPACRGPEACQGVFRPNPSDRQYIHPSVFSGGSRQYVQPTLSSPGRK